MNFVNEMEVSVIYFAKLSYSGLIELYSTLQNKFLDGFKEQYSIQCGFFKLFVFIFLNTGVLVVDR